MKIRIPDSESNPSLKLLRKTVPIITHNLQLNDIDEHDDCIMIRPRYF